MTSWDRLRQLCAVHQGEWRQCGLAVVDATGATVATCTSRFTAAYLVALHEWLLPLANELHVARLRLTDRRASETIGATRARGHRPRKDR